MIHAENWAPKNSATRHHGHEDGDAVAGLHPLGLEQRAEAFDLGFSHPKLSTIADDR